MYTLMSHDSSSASDLTNLAVMFHSSGFPVYSCSACRHFCTNSFVNSVFLVYAALYVVFIPAVPCHRNKSLCKVSLLRVILCSQSWREIKCNKKKRYCCQCKKRQFLAHFSDDYFFVLVQCSDVECLLYC